MIEFFQGLINQQGVQVLIVVIVLDTIFRNITCFKRKEFK